MNIISLKDVKIKVKIKQISRTKKFKNFHRIER